MLPDLDYKGSNASGWKNIAEAVILMITLMGIVRSYTSLYESRSLVCYIKLSISTQVPRVMCLYIIAIAILLGGVTTTLAGK